MAAFVSFTAFAKEVPSLFRNLLIIHRGGCRAGTGGKQGDSAGAARAVAWLDPMDHKTKGRMALATFVLVLAIFLPEVVSAGWHMIHGRSVRFRDWNIPVPFGWYATHSGEGVALERMLRFSLWHNAPVAVFLPVHFGKAFHFQYELFGAEQTRVLDKRGYVFKAQRDFRAAGQDGRCWVYSKVKDPSQRWIACIFPEEMFSADFTGSQTYAAQFYSILSRVEGAKP